MARPTRCGGIRICSFGSMPNEVINNPWHTRIGHVITDHNSSFCPIRLFFPCDNHARNTVNLQTLIQLWSGELAEKTALCRADPVTVLQLMRFDARGQKIKRKVCWTEQIRLPTFSNVNSTNLMWINYDVVTVVVHLGKTCRSGHYRTALFEGPNVFLSDDETSAA